MEKEKFAAKNLFLTVLCVGTLTLGIALTLSWWVDVVVLFKGAAGIVLALSGMLGLFFLKK